MEYMARVPMLGAEDGHSIMNVTDRFGAASSIEDAAGIMQDNGYHEGAVFAKNDSTTVIPVLESGHDTGANVIHLDQF